MSSNGRILIVEDNLITAEVIRHQLQRQGYTVVAAVSTGEEAIEIAAAVTLDAILMDIQLEGELDGIMAVRAIRERSDVPVIYITANTDQATVERARLTSASGYLPKPFDDRSLHTTIQMAVWRKRTESQSTADQDHIEAVITTDPLGRILNMNADAEQLTGWTTNESSGRDVTEVLNVSNSDGDDIDALVNRLLQFGLRPVSSSGSLHTASGRALDVCQTLSVIAGENGEVVGMRFSLTQNPQNPN